MTSSSVRICASSSESNHAIESHVAATKTLSVIVPNYNDSAHLEIQLRAICTQSFRPLEVIVVDDGSTDESIEIIKRVATEFPFVRLIRNATNCGAVFSINKARRMASGDYIYSASANDLVLPGLFEKSIRMLEQYPHAGLCCTDARQIDEVNGGNAWSVSAGWSQTPAYFSPAALAEMTRKLKHIRHPMTNTCIIRADAIPEDQMYDPGLICYGDWFLHQVIVSRHGCCYIPEPLAASRWTGSSFSHTVNSDPQLYKHVFKEVVKRFSLPEYEDVARLAIRGRVLMDFTPVPRSPLNTMAALQEMSRTAKQLEASSQSIPLLQHLTAEYLFSLPTMLKHGIARRLTMKSLLAGRFVIALAICVALPGVMITFAQLNPSFPIVLPLSGNSAWYRDLGGRNYPEIQDQDMFYQNIGPSITNVKSADIVILGPSFTIFAFEPNALDRFGRTIGKRFYNMSFLGIRGGEFSRLVVKRWNIKPKLWIVNVDDQFLHFFSKDVTVWLGAHELPNDTIKCDRFGGFLRVIKRNFRWAAEDIVTIWKDGKSADLSFYRCTKNGAMKVDANKHYSTDDRDNKQLAVVDKEIRHASKDTIEIGRQFLKDIGGKVIFVLVPHAQYCPTQARELAQALGVETIIPTVDGYTTFDGGGHLDKKSAVKFTEYFCAQLPKTRAFQAMVRENQGR